MSSENRYDAGRKIGEAIAGEAVLECADPVHGEMVSIVKFHDKERPDMLLDEYMKIVEFLGGRAADYFDLPGSFTNFEEGLYDGLNAHSALHDSTVGPY